MTVLQFQKPYKPDPRNGSVYACESIAWAMVDGVEVGTPCGFIVVHMSSGGNSAASFGDYSTIEEASAAARTRAREMNAEYLA